MFRYAGVLSTIAALVLLVAAEAVARSVPDGPRLLYARDGHPLPGEEVINSDPSGEQWFRVTIYPHSTGSVSGVAWSPDGAKAVIGSSTLTATATSTMRIVTIAAGGGKRIAVPGSTGGFAPAVSPDGSKIAFARLRFRPRSGNRGPFVSVAVWLIDAERGRARRLTPWRNGLLMIPGSFSPDGNDLAVTRQIIGRETEVVLQAVSGERVRRVAAPATEPAFSPDGSQIAFVRPSFRGLNKRHQPIVGGDLFVATPAGEVVQRLTRSPGRREEGPSWDPSGQRLAFTAYPVKQTIEALAGIGSSIVEINADGTCRRKVAFTYGLSYHDPVWQPGPGRDAGRIEC